jgi:hypothetical protein
MFVELGRDQEIAEQILLIESEKQSMNRVIAILLLRKE